MNIGFVVSLSSPPLPISTATQLSATSEPNPGASPRLVTVTVAPTSLLPLSVPLRRTALCPLAAPVVSGCSGCSPSASPPSAPGPLTPTRPTLRLSLLVSQCLESSRHPAVCPFLQTPPPLFEDHETAISFIPSALYQQHLCVSLHPGIALVSIGLYNPRAILVAIWVLL
jgi:hypothetical protein